MGETDLLVAHMHAVKIQNSSNSTRRWRELGASTAAVTALGLDTDSETLSFSGGFPLNFNEGCQEKQ
jgi:hypothetical protein